MDNRYLVIKGTHTHEIVIEKSRFICNICRVESEEAANQFLQSLKKKHYNASHHCLSYIIGEQRMIQKSSDDGEPTGTAGIPMLEVLKKKGLTDTVCVVTRYFGGKKLGAGGLIRAYSQSVNETIQEIGILERKPMQVLRLTFDYSLIGTLEHHLSTYLILHKEFTEKVVFKILVDLNDVSSFMNKVIDLTHNKILIETLTIEFYEVDYLK